MNHIPVAVGMLLCEQVIVEEGSKNVTPVNCFSVRELPETPNASSFLAVAWLADGLGEMVAELIVDRLDIYEEIFRLERRLDFQNPLENMRFIGKIRNCIFPVFGQYQVSLVIERELIAHRKFTLRKKRKQS